MNALRGILIGLIISLAMVRFGILEVILGGISAAACVLAADFAWYKIHRKSWIKTHK